jgi:hypothetical protein
MTEEKSDHSIFEYAIDERADNFSEFVFSTQLRKRCLGRLQGGLPLIFWHKMRRRFRLSVLDGKFTISYGISLVTLKAFLIEA